MNAKQLTYLVIPLLLLTACGGGSEEGDERDEYVNPSSKNKTVLTTPSAGRILAAQCAQCHGTDGISVSGIDDLAGESGEIREEMLEMQGKNRNRIMHLQAKGYTRDEINQIASYFSGLYRGGGSNNTSDNDDRDNEQDDNYNDRDDD